MRVVAKMRGWKGLDKGDNQYRLYQSLSRNFPRKLRSYNKRGKLMKTFNMHQLLEIAWKTGVTNPDGIDRTDARFWGLSYLQGFEFYLTGWEGVSKTHLMNYIWNRLYDTERIRTI